MLHDNNPDESQILDYHQPEDNDSGILFYLQARQPQKRIDIVIQRHEFVAFSWPKLKRHIVYQFLVETELLKECRNWVYILIGIVIIYIHISAYKLAYFLASPLPPLADIMYMIVPPLPTNSVLFHANTYILIVMFSMLAIKGLSILVIKHPSVLNRTLIGYVKRFFIVINVTQLMRITTFLVTQVPSPSPNCSAPFFDPPKRFKDIFKRSIGSVDNSCGDLIFSSHVMFAYLIVLMNIKYLGLNSHEKVEGSAEHTRSLQHVNDIPGSSGAEHKRIIVLISRKQYILRIVLIGFSCICLIADVIVIIASRKHYTVDLLLSFYITYPVWKIMETKIKDPEIPGYLCED